jgi:uncharacterized MAPEG superfamily protein
LAYLPHAVRVLIAMGYKGTKYNNETPRTEQYKTYGALGDLMNRAAGAHYNALEMFPFFASAVLVARVQKVKPQVITPLCFKYIALRIVYTFLYIFGINKYIAALRTLSWATMIKVILEIFKNAL